MDILIPILTLSALGLIFGLGLAYASKIFYIKIDPKVDKLLGVLPGANCGVCGFAGCQALAEALAEGRAFAEACVPGGETVHGKVAGILGVKAKPRIKTIATLICAGGRRAKDIYEYKGPKDCVVANAYHGGPKACSFGCTGFGSCVAVCPFGAMKMDDNMLPVVDSKLCTACGKCITICPKNILELRPVKNHIWVACNSTDKGGVVTKVCGHGCIGCAKCVSACKFDAIHVVDNLAKIDYDKCINCRQCALVCPTKAIKTDYK